jgi:hypothetical protein
MSDDQCEAFSLPVCVPRTASKRDATAPLRGQTDHLLRTLWYELTFGAGDFQANKAGAVVVQPSLRRVLAEACRLPQRGADDETRTLRDWLLDEVYSSRYQRVCENGTRERSLVWAEQTGAHTDVPSVANQMIRCSD